MNIRYSIEENNTPPWLSLEQFPWCLLYRDQLKNVNN